MNCYKLIPQVFRGNFNFVANENSQGSGWSGSLRKISQWYLTRRPNIISPHKESDERRTGII